MNDSEQHRLAVGLLSSTFPSVLATAVPKQFITISQNDTSSVVSDARVAPQRIMEVLQVE